MVTIDRAKQYLEGQGTVPPDYVLAGDYRGSCRPGNSIQECLDGHCMSTTALLIQLYLLGLMGLGQGDRYISSQTAPSGASRSFRYQRFADRWSGALLLVRGLGKYGWGKLCIDTPDWRGWIGET